MEKIFEIASNISTPLSLAGIFATIFFFIVRQIISGKDRQWKISNKTLVFIINKLFQLAITAMILGFSGWVISAIINSNGIKKTSLKFSVYVDNKPVEGIQVFALNVEGQAETNRDGIVRLEFDQTDSIILEIKSKEFNIDSLTKPLSVNGFPKIISLYTKKEIFTNEELCELIMMGVNDYHNNFTNLLGKLVYEGDEEKIYDVPKSNNNSNLNISIEDWFIKGQQEYLNYSIVIYSGSSMEMARQKFSNLIEQITECFKIKESEGPIFNVDYDASDTRLKFFAVFERYNEKFILSAVGPNIYNEYVVSFGIKKNVE